MGSRWCAELRSMLPFPGIVCLGFLLAVSAPPACAQLTSGGTVSGQVTDPQNAAVAGAEVVLTDPSTNSKRTTTTNDVGRYIFIDLPPGQYDLAVTKEGFKQAQAVRQTVDVGFVLTLNVVLELGATTTSIQVQAAPGAELQTMNATVGTTITGSALMNLPNLGRDANAFYSLQPAVGPGGNVAGAQTDQNMFQLDGGNNSSDQDGTYANYTQASGQITAGSGGNPSGVMPTPTESIEEFKVSSNGQTADFNGAAGGQVQMVTKRGSNQFHGAGYEYYFGGNWGANNWLNNHTPNRFLGLPYTPLPSTHQNRFGAALGGPLTPSFAGGRTYFFFNYEGRRFPNVTTIDRLTPTPLMRAGVIQVLNSSGQWIPYNLNPGPVTVNGTTYQPAACPAGACDPRGVGLNPIISQIWNKYMPLPNDASAGDGHNTQGYLTTLPLPLTSNFAVARIDHDFGPNWRFMGSYRYYKFNQYTSSEVDIGGALPGDTLGVASSKTLRPQQPSYFVAGLTGVITPRLINDFRWSYLRNDWTWISPGSPAQSIPGLSVAVEPYADSSSSLIPYPVDRGDALSRFWDGQDHIVRDDLTLNHGNHLFQFGGQYGRNFDKHQRNDNGINILSWPVDQINSGPGIVMPTNYVPTGVPTNQLSTYSQLYATVTGMVSQSQVMYARSNGLLQPVPSSIMSQTVLASYGGYFGDTWHMKPTFTLIYGLGYSVEMPPHEINGNLPMMVDANDNFITGEDYMAQRQRLALSGQSYTPTIGFATMPYIEPGQKYPFPPFYGAFTPHVAAAWSSKFTSGPLGKLLPANKTVIRAGYNRTYARLNGINFVQVPLQGTGVGQPVSCIGLNTAGQCLGTGGVDPTNAFRIGVDGSAAPIPSVSQLMPEPLYPGVNGNPTTGSSWTIDHKMKPAHTDQVDFTIQRELTQKSRIEFGYVGTRTQNQQVTYNLDSVPYMTTLNGQSFAQAFSNMYWSLYTGGTPAVQPFMESALGGANSSYCAGFGSCTAAVASKVGKTQILTTQVYNLWASLNSASSWTLGRTMPSSSGAGTMANPAAQSTGLPEATTNGWSNYNGAFVSLIMGDWHGLTASSNITWSHALGTGTPTDNGQLIALDQWNLRSMYGPMPYDVKLVYNLLMMYQPPVFKGQHGVLGQVLGGWKFAPLFTARTGYPLLVSISGGASTNCQSFGESNCAVIASSENAPAIAPYTAGNSAHYNVSSTGAGSSGNLASGGSGINLFANPAAVFSDFRRLVLGFDTSGGGQGALRAFPTWNLDLGVLKDIRIREGKGITLNFQFTNVLNHFQAGNPSLSIDSPATFGVVSSQANTPRQIEIGARAFF